MAFMKFYVGNETNASSHRDGIYIAVDTKKIFYNGSAYGGSEVDLSNYYTIAQVNGKIGTNVYTGANYISKETNLTEAVLQLDEEIKATNDNLALEHTNAEATYAKKTELGKKLDISTYTSDKSTFALKSEIPNVSNFLTISNAQSTYLTKTDAKNNYQPKGNYLTSVSIATISDLNANWDALLKSAPSGYVTRWPSISEVTGKQNLVIKLNGGSTEGTSMFTFNGTGAKSVNITASKIGAAASSHSHTISQISDLHANWDSLLKATPTSYVTRWPSISEVTGKQNLTIYQGDSTVNNYNGTSRFILKVPGYYNFNFTRNEDYFKLFTIRLTKSYINHRICFDITGRSGGVDHVYLSFSNGSVISAYRVITFGYIGVGVYGPRLSIRKVSGTSTEAVFEIYLAATQLYDECTVFNFIGNYTGFNIEIGGPVTSLPSGTTACVGLNVFRGIAKASTTAIGGIKVGNGLEIESDGTLNCTVQPGSGTVSWGNIQGKPSVFATNIATISDLNANWDALLKSAPSGYVTRWPNISEVGSKQNLVIKLNGGTTEGTNQFTYNVTAAKSINITPSSIGAAASSHNHNASQVSGLSKVATSGSYNDLTNKPTIPSAYTLPKATTSTLGGIKVGDGLEITGDGTLNCIIDPGSGTVSWGNIQGKPSVFATNIASINDLNSGWDALLKAAPNIPSLNGYATQEWVNGRGFLTKTTADGYYQPKGNYLTSVSWSQISDRPTILALGTTSSTAFRGDYGNTAYQHAAAKGAAFSSGLYKITTNAQGHVTAATKVVKSDITALGIPGSDSNPVFQVYHGETKETLGTSMIASSLVGVPSIVSSTRTDTTRAQRLSFPQFGLKKDSTGVYMELLPEAILGTVPPATTSADGLMSSEDKTKLDGLSAISTSEIDALFS